MEKRNLDQNQHFAPVWGNLIRYSSAWNSNTAVCFLSSCQKQSRCSKDKWIQFHSKWEKIGCVWWVGFLFSFETTEMGIWCKSQWLCSLSFPYSPSISLEPLQPFVEDRFDSIIPISLPRIRVSSSLSLDLSSHAIPHGTTTHSLPGSNLEGNPV